MKIGYTVPSWKHLATVAQNRNAKGKAVVKERSAEAATELAPSLAEIFNHSFKTGTTPQEWRDATVTPIYKNNGSNRPRQTTGQSPSYQSSMSCCDHQRLDFESCPVLRHVHCMSVHFLDSNWELQGYGLATCLVDGSHTAANLADHVQPIAEKFNIQDKISATVPDEVANSHQKG